MTSVTVTNVLPNITRNSKKAKDIRKSQYVIKKIPLNVTPALRVVPRSPHPGLMRNQLCSVRVLLRSDSTRMSQTLRKKGCETERAGKTHSWQLW